MTIRIAGRSKPHRCVEPGCWAASDLARWRRYLPRRCRNGHWTLTTWPRAWYGTTWPKRSADDEPINTPEVP